MDKVSVISFSSNYDMVRSVVLLHNQLIEEGVNSKAYVSKNSKYIFDETKGLKKYNFPLRPDINFGIIFKMFSLLNVIFSLIKNKPKTIYFESAHVWNYLIILLFRKTEIIHVVHDVIPHPGEGNSDGVIKYYNMVFPKVDKFLLHNEKYIEYFSKEYNVDKSRILSTNLWSENFEWVEPKFSKNVLFFGRVNPYKGYYELVKIMNKMPKVHFTIAGKFSDELLEDKHLVEELENCTVIDKYLEDYELENEFINSDIICLPYTSATQSGVVLEAYKRSKTVIAFNVGALGEQIIDKETGYLIDEGNIDQFVDVLKDYLDSSDNEKRELCKQAHSYYIENMSVSSITRKLMEFLELS